MSLALRDKQATHPGRIPRPFYAIPDPSANGTHGKSAAKVIKDHPRTRKRVRRGDGGRGTRYQGSRVWSAWAMVKDGEGEGNQNFQLIGGLPEQTDKAARDHRVC
jgi:hypothetical protein